MAPTKTTEAAKSRPPARQPAASAARHPLNAMLALQGSAGNRAVVQMLGRGGAAANLPSRGEPLDAGTRELTEGMHLLADELAHVVQQRRRSGTPSGARETERGARDASEAVTRGRAPAITDKAAAGAVQMQPAPGTDTGQTTPETDRDKEWADIVRQSEEHPILVEGKASHEFDDLFAASKALGYLLPVDTPSQYEDSIRNRVKFLGSTEYADSWSADERWEYAEATPEVQAQMSDDKWRAFVNQGYMAYLRDQAARWDQATRRMSAAYHVAEGISVVSLAPAIVFGGGEVIAGGGALVEGAGTALTEAAPRLSLWLIRNPLLATELAGSALGIAESGKVTPENVLWAILSAFSGHAGDVGMRSAPESVPDVGPINRGGGGVLNKLLLSTMLGFSEADVTPTFSAGGVSSQPVATEVVATPAPGPAGYANAPENAPDLLTLPGQAPASAPTPAPNVAGSTDPSFWTQSSTVPSAIRTGTAEDRSISDLLEYAKQKIEAQSVSTAAQQQQQPATLAQTGTGGPVVGSPAITASANRTGGSTTAKAGSVSPASTTRTRPSSGSQRSARLRATASGPTPKAVLGNKFVKRYGLTKQEANIVERATELYVREMAGRKSKPAYIASQEAHRAAQDQLTTQFKNVVAEEPTGLTGPKAPRSDANLRSSDIQINRQPGTGTDLKSNIAAVIDFKRTAFLNNKGVLVVNGLEPDADVEKDQIQSYEVGYRELGIPAFITNQRGEIFAPNPGASQGWIKVGEIR